MANHSISDSKLDSLNLSFVKMTRAVHCFGGEVRDMLFDDKGCVFIATFGAHPLSAESQRNKRASMKKGLVIFFSMHNLFHFKKLKASSLLLKYRQDLRTHPHKAVLAALAISSLVEGARIGLFFFLLYFFVQKFNFFWCANMCRSVWRSLLCRHVRSGKET